MEQKRRCWKMVIPVDISTVSVLSDPAPAGFSALGSYENPDMRRST